MAFTQDEENVIKAGLPMFVALKTVSEAQAKLEDAQNAKQVAAQSAMATVNEAHDANIVTLTNALNTARTTLNDLLKA